MASKDFDINLKQSEVVSAVFKSFSHPLRLRILCQLAQKPSSVQELQEACGVEQVIMSQALAKLRREGRVRAERDANRMVYSLADERLVDLMQQMIRIYCGDKKK
jgi:DNA-binding transcriptional ArsR family regulator